MTIDNKETPVVEEKKATTTRKRNTKTTTKTKNTVSIKRELRKNAKDISLEVSSLVNGDVLFIPKKNDLGALTMGDRDSTDEVSLALLVEMKKEARGLLEKLVITVTDVYSDEYKLNDIIDFLELKDLYEFEDMSIEAFKSFIIDTDAAVFEAKFNAIKNKAVKNRLVEISVDLYRKNLLDSNFKRSVFEQYSGNEYLYKVI